MVQPCSLFSSLPAQCQSGAQLLMGPMDLCSRVYIRSSRTGLSTNEEGVIIFRDSVFRVTKEMVLLSSQF